MDFCKIEMVSGPVILWNNCCCCCCWVVVVALAILPLCVFLAVEEEVPAEPKKNEEKPFKPIKLDPELAAPPAPRRNARRKK